MRRRTNRLSAVLFAMLVALLAVTAVGAAPGEGLTARVSVEQDQFGPTESVLVELTLSNPTRHTLRILRWLTPVDGVDEPLFTVTRDGAPVAYLGAHAKRPAATGKDYVSLKAGESLTRIVDLGELYDLSTTGHYEIAYRVTSATLFDERGAGAPTAVSLGSEKISVQVSGRAGKGKPGGGGGGTPPPPGGQNFNACTTTQQSLLISARSEAKNYASGAFAYLQAGTTGPRYTTWFGEVTGSRYTTVTSNFSAISDAMTNAGFVFDCSSKRNVYAYVYPNDHFRIYLGRVFWSAPLTGTDSKAGTLIHETSHFTVVAGTDDVVYGQTGAKSLAISDPDSAVRNADSHEYFAENTPAQD